MPPGLVILDTNCYRHLRTPGQLDRLLGSLRTVDLDLWATGINLLEIARNPHLGSRQADLATIRRLAEGRGVLPLPERLLGEAANALSAGVRGFWTGRSHLEDLLDGDAHLKPDVQKAISAWLDQLDANFEAMHARARPEIQARLQKHGLRGAWGSAAGFLDEYWMRVELHDTALDGWWRRFGLPTPPPYAEVLADAVWRLFIELEGVGVYERAVLVKQPKCVHFSDLAQLLYLSGTARRVVVTNDGPLRRAAVSFLVGRYPGVRVLSWTEFEALI